MGEGEGTGLSRGEVSDLVAALMKNYGDAYWRRVDRERAERHGATDFLTKPFSPKKLLARIEQLFDH